MGIATPELGPDSFRLAGQAERALRADGRRRAKAGALSALHDARDAFMGHVRDQRLGGDADHDGDILEAVAERLLDWVQTLEHDFERLQPARDQARHRGAVLTRQRAPFDAGALAQAVAEALAEAALSDHASAVLVAAVRHAAA